mmetsp:Transcript_10336/g.38351  ORF Transcript_10336/g.38351 Transcript_10336/m.38351 type:complete len:291 (+) Transcript_10336:559-1431(+)
MGESETAPTVPASDPAGAGTVFFTFSVLETIGHANTFPSACPVYTTSPWSFISMDSAPGAVNTVRTLAWRQSHTVTAPFVASTARYAPPSSPAPDASATSFPEWPFNSRITLASATENICTTLSSPPPTASSASPNSCVVNPLASTQQTQLSSPPPTCVVFSFLNCDTTATLSPKCSSSYTVAKSPPQVANKFPNEVWLMPSPVAGPGSAVGRWLNRNAATLRSVVCSFTIVLTITLARRSALNFFKSEASASSASLARFSAAVGLFIVPRGNDEETEEKHAGASSRVCG